MRLLQLVALLRLIPYAIVGVIAYKKGYRWLTYGAIYLVSVALFTTFADISPQFRSMLGSITAVFLLLHAIDLRSRK